MTSSPRCPAVARLTAWLFAGALLVLSSVGAGAGDAPQSFSGIAKQLLPAVVSISTTQTIDQGSAPPGPGGGPGLEGGPGLGGRGQLDEFFGEFFGGNAPAQPVNALGSGFIIDPTGFVVTNNHVVAEAQDVVVKLADGRSLKAKVVGTDPATDLALLKVEAGGKLPHVRWGASEKAEIGDWVVAVGNSFGLSSTLTAGILSGRARDIQSGPYDDFLQTDAAINSGNSGGPLFDMNGTVIGVNTAILSPTGGNIGIGFAIPSSTAKPIVEQLRKSGVVRRGWLGVQIQPVTEQVASALGLKESRGALVADVVPNGPAAKAGLRPGDVILSFDDAPVTQARDLPRIVANTEIGRTADIRVWRDGQERSLEADVTLRKPARTAGLQEPGEQMPSRGQQHSAALGMTLAPLDEDIRRQLEIDKDVSGALVTAVEVGGPAASNGLQPGDVIVEVSRQKVSGPQQVVDQVEKARREGRDAALLRIVRGGSYQFTAVPV